MKHLFATALVAGLLSEAAIAQAPPAQKSIPLPSESGQAPAVSQTVPSTEALAWSQKTLAGWPEATRRLGAQLFTKYGAPAETTARRVTWVNNGPWVSTTLLKEGPQHNFAAPHKDVLEQTIRYKVPVEKLTELAKFNRSIVPNLTRGELTAISDSEEINFLGLNVADEVLNGTRSAEEARTYYAQIVRAKMIKEPEKDLAKLKFAPPKTAAEAADADEVAPLIKHMNGGDAAPN
jgi:hypothetical protein